MQSRVCQTAPLDACISAVTYLMAEESDPTCGDWALVLLVKVKIHSPQEQLLSQQDGVCRLQRACHLLLPPHNLSTPLLHPPQCLCEVTPPGPNHSPTEFCFVLGISSPSRSFLHAYGWISLNSGPDSLVLPPLELRLHRALSVLSEGDGWAQVAPKGTCKHV